MKTTVLKLMIIVIYACLSLTLWFLHNSISGFCSDYTTMKHCDNQPILGELQERFYYIWTKPNTCQISEVCE